MDLIKKIIRFVWASILYAFLALITIGFVGYFVGMGGFLVYEALTNFRKPVLDTLTLSFGMWMIIVSLGFVAIMIIPKDKASLIAAIARPIAVIMGIIQGIVFPLMWLFGIIGITFSSTSKLGHIFSTINRSYYSVGQGFSGIFTFILFLLLFIISGWFLILGADKRWIIDQYKKYADR